MDAREGVRKLVSSPLYPSPQLRHAIIMVNKLKFFSGFLLLSIVASAPTLDADLEPRAVNCAIVSTVVNYFVKSTAAASSFCSSYLQTTVLTTTSVTAKSTQLTTTSLALVTATSTFTLYVLIALYL
jgi:hypothetical protein